MPEQLPPIVLTQLFSHSFIIPEEKAAESQQTQPVTTIETVTEEITIAATGLTQPSLKPAEPVAVMPVEKEEKWFFG